MILAGGAIDLRLGDWRDVLADVVACDAVICDPPYTSRVEFGYRSGSGIKKDRDTTVRKFTIPYGSMTTRDARSLAGLAVRLRARFAVIFNDHVGWRWLERSFKARGWYCFAPLIWDRVTPAPRFQGDGPTDAVEHVLVTEPSDPILDYIAVARPRIRNYVGSLPGIYRHASVSQGVGSTEGIGLTGQKPLGLMRAIVRDYTKPGDLIVDPFCGGGTTALACAIEGRRCITSEIDPATFEKARARIERGHTPDMFTAEPK